MYAFSSLVDFCLVFAQIAKGTELEHPTEVHDRSNPNVPADAKLKMNWSHEAVLKDISKIAEEKK